MRPAAPPLAGPPRGVVDAWAIPLLGSGPLHERCVRALSADERGHAARMRLGREAWMRAHGALRLVLAHYLEVPPDALEFARAPLGKPRLADAHGPRFNLSWRPELALVGVASDRDVGVDLEREDERVNVARLAADHLSGVDAADVVRAPAEHRRAAFYAAWTRHEARRKLHGLALEDEPPALASGEMVVVRAVSLAAGYAAAIAAPGAAWTVRRRDVAELG